MQALQGWIVKTKSKLLKMAWRNGWAREVETIAICDPTKNMSQSYQSHPCIAISNLLLHDAIFYTITFHIKHERKHVESLAHYLILFIVEHS